MPKIIRKILKILAWIIASIFLLLILVYILIQIPAAQNFGRKKIVAYLENKLKTKVEIGKLSIDFPKRIVLQNIYIEDQKKDTLLLGKEIRVDISLFKLLSSKVDINYVELNGIKTHIYRLNPDTTFNYNYIIQAFSSDKKKDIDTSSSTKININEVVLKDITASFKDDATGNNASVYIGNFETHISKFDPDHKIFTIPSIAFKNINAKIHQYKPLLQLPTKEEVASQTKAPAAMPSIQLNALTLNNIQFDYKNDISALYANLNLGELLVHPDKIDLQTLFVNLKDIELNNTAIKIAQGKTTILQQVKDTVIKKVEEQSNSWQIELANINFNNNHFVFDNNNNPKASSGMDYNHLNVQGFVFKGKDMRFTPSSYQGIINHLSFKEQSGFDLKTLQTHFIYNDTTAALQQLVFQTDQSLLKDNIQISYPSIQALSKRPGELYIQASLKQSTLAVKDILTFIPAFKRNMKGNEQSVFRINTNIYGYLKDLSIPVFELSGLKNTYVKLSGKIKGLPVANKSYFDIQIQQFASSKNDVQNIIPPKALSAIQLPDQFSIHGFFKGGLADFSTHIALLTNKGNADVLATMHNKAYSAKVSLYNLDAGYLLKQKDIGQITLNASVSSSNTDFKKANTNYSANIIAANLKGYTYKNLTLSGSAYNGIIKTIANIKDKNIAFQLDATADINKKYPAIQLKLLLDTLNAYALHLMKDTLSIHANLVADLPSTNPDFLNGKINITDIKVANATKQFNTDSIAITATSTEAEKNITIISNVLKASMAGQYKLTELAQALQQTLNKYYTLPGYKEKNITPQQWTLNTTIIPTDLAIQLLPSIKGSDSIVMQTDFNSTNNDLNITVKSKKIMYNTQQLDSINITAKAESEKFNVDINLQNLKSNSFNLYRTSIGASLANNEADITFNTKDIKQKDHYQIAGLLKQINKGFQFILQPKGLLLNYDQWTVTNDNFIQYSPSGLLVNNFKINNQDQALSINSTSQTANAPIQINFNQFKISTLTKIANQNSLPLEGTINGDAELKNLTQNPLFTSNLTLDNVIYQKDTVGNITIKVNNEQANTLAANIAISGKDNDVKLDGMYYLKESRMDFKLNMAQFNLASIKPFAADQIKNISGFLKGNLAITGKPTQPILDGSLHFDNTIVTPAISGETIKISNNNIEFDNKGINLNEFSLTDSAGNKATINGNVYTTDFRKYRFDLSANTKNFRLVNAPQAPNRLFYGNLNLDADVDVTGNMQSPKLSGNIKINKGTNFSLVLPNKDPEVEDREGVVRFIDKKHPAIASNKKSVLDSITNQTELKGMDISATIETDTAAQFTLFIDERNGDALSLKGKADLAVSIDKSGKTSLTGNYQLQQGHYQLALNFLNRRFEIQKGSLITWTGDPKSAQIDITATYLAKTAPIDLVGPQLSGRPQNEVNRFKEKLPFQVNLKMKGELLKPVITFDVTLNEDVLAQWPDVDAKLQQIRSDESELNKQVFALLLLNRFVGENPLQSEAGSAGAEGMARQTASKILTDQLNQLAGNIVKGVDINFDLNSEQDYSTGEAANRTDLNVGVSKRLLNDRIQVNVGSNFELEGPQNSNRDASNIAGDVSVDYKLSKDGRYTARAYRKNKYEGVVEGQIIETGVSFIFTLDYNKFKELFQSKKTPIQTKKIKKKISTTSK